MKIAIRGGHNFQARGAVGIIDETTEDRHVKDAVIVNLKQAGHDVLDVTPNECDQFVDLSYGVNKANEWGAELFASIHFNCIDGQAKNSPIGTEVWIYGTGGKAEPIAHRVVDAIANSTGLINRGVKVSTGLYELRKTNMSAMIVEVCFVDSQPDVDIYRSKGFDFIGKQIAEAINGASITPVSPVIPQIASSPIQVVPKSEFKTNAKALVNLDPRDRAGNPYVDLGEIFANERIVVLPEVCDKTEYLPVSYWKDSLGRASDRVWINAKHSVLSVDMNASVINVKTELDARYNPSPDSSKMGYVGNGERVYVHKIEGNYALATYNAGDGYKTAWFTKIYILLD